MWACSCKKKDSRLNRRELHGRGIAAALVNVPEGSSAYFEGGLVAYSYGIISADKGAVSEEVVRQMSEAARKNLG